MKPKANQGNAPTKIDENAKLQDLEPNRVDPTGTTLTTDQGLRLPDTDNSLKVGARGPTLMEDFHFREKMTHFDHERIPERVVHARGFGVHGYFQVYESLADLTMAKFLQDPSVKTPVFVRFSTVGGSRGSADTVRDVRGFATKFYTEEGNFDLVGNNIPVFFIQDGIKFPDFVHSVKPEPHHEIPQASSAHDTFWDFCSLVTESTHMLMWHLSDRAIPRSFRMMQGFGVHTFRLVNKSGVARFVKFHWRPLLGVHSLVWDEAQKLAGKDPDYHRRDIWEAIEAGQYPEYELGVQIVDEADEHRFDFDLLDATKIIPEELVPVRPVGKMVLNRNTDNFFAETEQVAFHIGNLVPGIDVTNDPLLQARLFSYLDTQLTRLGGPNFAQIPINRPVVPVSNQNQDGFHQHRVIKSRVNYSPNSIGGNCPMLGRPDQGAYVHYTEKVEGHKIRERSPSFADHYSQATLFWNSMSPAEKEHIVQAARFELGKVESKAIRQRVIDQFANVDVGFAAAVAEGIGVKPPSGTSVVARAARAVANAISSPDKSPALSQENTVKGSIATRRVAILAAEGFSGAELTQVQTALTTAGAKVEIIARTLGTLKGSDGTEIEVTRNAITTGSIFYDAVFVPGGKASAEALKKLGDAKHFVNEAFKHCKAIAAIGEGVGLLQAGDLAGIKLADGSSSKTVVDKGVVTAKDGSDLQGFIKAFIEAIGQHRHWDRAEKEMVPA